MWPQDGCIHYMYQINYRLYTRKCLWPMYLEANTIPFNVGSLKANSFSAKYLSTKKATRMQSTRCDATPFLLLIQNQELLV